MNSRTEMPSVAAVIVAAGNSTRMGMPKQLLPLAGRPVLSYAMEAFEACHIINEIVVVARGEEVLAIYDLARTYHITKLTHVVLGGESRQASVANGVNACRNTADYYAIHDGARPLVTPTLIDCAVAAAVETGAAAVAVRVKDTVKLADDRNRIVSTPDRSHLWNVQTPQVFERSLYREAMRAAEGASLTDDCQLIERLGCPVQLVEGSYRNLKITTPEDLAVAEAYLR